MENRKNSVVYYRKKFRPLDFFIILFFLSLAAFLFTLNMVESKNGDTVAVVRRDSEELLTVNLSEISEPYIYCIGDDFNVKIEFKHNSAGIIYSDCSDQICVNTGELHNAGQSAVCLPARISLEIRNLEEEEALDGVTG